MLCYPSAIIERKCEEMKKQKQTPLPGGSADQPRKPARKIHLPKPRLRWRLLLYAATVLTIVVTLYCVITECLPAGVDWALYVAAGVIFFPGIVCFILDMRHLIGDLIIPKVMSVPFAQLLAGDYRLRTILFSVPGLAGNVIFAVFNGVTGVMSRSAWFGSLSAYYLLLGIMRVIAVVQERRIAGIREEAERIPKEITVYRADSILFVFLAVVQGSPLLTILRRINYIDACVSILTLQTAMFASFSVQQETLVLLMNGITGSVVSLMVLALGILGIALAKRMTVKWKEKQ